MEKRYVGKLLCSIFTRIKRQSELGIDAELTHCLRKAS